MTALRRELEQSLRKLSPRERSQLAKDLLSGRYEPKRTAEDEWVEEIDRRLKSMDEGKVRFVSRGQAMKVARARAAKARSR